MEIPDRPVFRNLIESAAKHSNNTALIFGNVVEPLGDALVDAKMSYRTLLNPNCRFAAALQRMGGQKGRSLGHPSPKLSPVPIAYYATLMAGGIVVPCNPVYVARELPLQLNDADAEAIITLSLTCPMVKQIRAQTPAKRVITNVKEHFPSLLNLLFTVARE